MSTEFSNPKERLFIPFLGPFYDGIAQPLGWLVLRLAVGVALMHEGWPKILAPFAQTGFVEGLGFFPGWLWSPLLAILQFVGGFLIAIGLFTRPVALASAVMLAITWWFHWTHPFGDVLLTPEGIAFLKENSHYLTQTGLRRLADGGAGLLATADAKSLTLSPLWAAGALFFAAFGGGLLSVDRQLRRQF